MRSLVLAPALILLPAWSLAAPVSLMQDADGFKMPNGELTTRIEKCSGRVTSVVLGGRELLGKGAGYWSMAVSSARFQVEGFGTSSEQFIAIDPKSNGGGRAEVVCRFRGTGKDGAFPGTSEIRYAIDRESTTLYATAILSHGAGDPSFRIGEGRFVIKLDPGIFDQLTVDKDRNWVMPTCLDWDQGTPLNLKEARRMTTGVHLGWAEHKYGYSAILEKVPAYGWLGTQRKFGVWMINPSVEYIAGGPTKMELTGHLDVGGTSQPTLLNMWHGSHYGGTVLTLDQDEKWSKVIGPFAIHFNNGGSPAALWASALQRAAVERKAWPYKWLHHEQYPPAADRGGLSGKIHIHEVPAVPISGDQVPAGGTLLRVDFCGSREGSSVALSLNGSEFANTGPLPENGTMHRDSHRGFWFERTFPIPAGRLLVGENILQFRLCGTAWHHGVLYDSIRMETISPLEPAS